MASIQFPGGDEESAQSQGAVDAQAVRAELKAILASSTFAGASRVQRFLRFIVGRALAGQGESLKEYLVGVEVFDRPSSFEPQSDSVVRVEARRLRAKLEEYYGKEGKDDPIVIEVPKGGYRPSIRSAVALACQTAPARPPSQPMEAAGEDTVGSLPGEVALASRPAVLAASTPAAGLSAPQETSTRAGLLPQQAERRLAGNPGQEAGAPRAFWTRWRFARRRRLVAAAIVALACLPAAVFVRWRKTLVPVPIASIAVLPLETYGDNQEWEYLAQGLPEGISESLSVTPGLRVIAQGSASRLRDENPAQRAQKLHVASILTGSVTPLGNSALINLSLMEAHGQQLWAGTYELPVDSALNAARYQISRDVLRALGLRASNGAAGGAASGMNPKGQRAYLIGRFYWNKRDAESLRRSVDLFQQAIAADPTYAPAHAALADVYAVMAMNDQAPPGDAVPKARQSAQRALALDEKLAEAHAVMAWIQFFYDRAGDAAEADFRRALELNPNYATAHQWYGLTLIAQGRFDDAIREFRTASQLDPLSLIAQTDIGVAEYYARRYPLALRDAQAASAFDPSFFWGHALIGAIETEQSKLPEAIAELERAKQLGGNDIDCIMRLAVAYVRAGQPERAMPLLQQLIRESQRTQRAHYQLACLYAALGDKQRALEWLRLAYRNSESGLAFFSVDPLMDDVRADPQSAALLRSLNLAR